MNKEQFDRISTAVIEAGYSDEILWQRELKPCNDPLDFFLEACWVILNSGMKEQIARKIWERIKVAWEDDKPTSSAFNHKGKVAAIDFIKENYVRLFEEYQDAENKTTYLQTIPFIGKITCYHLAKNLGHDVVKPDRHLVRIAEIYNTTPDLLCENISKETGEKKCVVDIIIWRACNLKII